MGKKERQPRIIVVGSSNTDMIVQAERIPRPGETVLGRSFQMAAGDVFNGALAAALAEGRTLEFAARFANAAAAISVTRLGAQPSAPRRREIERFLEKRLGPLKNLR